MIASLLQCPWLFWVFWLISTMLSSGYSRYFSLISIYSSSLSKYVWAVLSSSITIGWLVRFYSISIFVGFFNAKLIFIQIISSISSNSVKHKYTVYLSNTVQFQAIQFSISIVFAQTRLNVKTVLFRTILFIVSTISMSKIVLFQTIQYSIST